MAVPIFLISAVGEDGYGAYALLISIAGYFTIADLSLDAFLIPKISSYKSDKSLIIAGAKVSFTVISIIVLTISLITLIIIQNNNVLGLKKIQFTTIFYFALYSALQLLLTGAYIIASGNGKLNEYNKKILYTNLLYIFNVFLLKHFKLLTIDTLILVRLAANLLAVADTVLTKSIVRDFKCIFLVFNKEMLLFTKYSLLGKAISYVSFNFDKMVLATFLTLDQVGIVAFPMQLGLAVVMGASRFCIPMLPISSDHANNKNMPLFDKTILYFIDIVLLVIGFFVSTFIIWIPYLVPHIYSSQIKLYSVQTPFSLILMGFWMISWSSIPANILPGWGRMKLNVLSSAVRALFIFSTMLLFIKKVGILSVGISILMGGLWEVVFLFWFLTKNRLYVSFQRARRLSLIVFVVMFSAIFINSLDFNHKLGCSILLNSIFLFYLFYHFQILNFKKCESWKNLMC